jgi:hypothetical protein
MDEFLKEFQEPYEGPYKAGEIFKLTIEALLDSLSPVFHQIKKAANSGADYVEIREELSDDQKWLLEKYGYDVVEFDEDDDEYKEGFKYQLQWFDEYFDNEDDDDRSE